MISATCVITRKQHYLLFYSFHDLGIIMRIVVINIMINTDSNSEIDSLYEEVVMTGSLRR